MMGIRELMEAQDQEHIGTLARIGGAIGYGRAQQLLGDLWDAMLDERYPSPEGVARSSRGRMGVTVDDKLPPVPKAQHKRRAQKSHGGYEMVPAYTTAELKAYARAAIDKALGEQQAG